jgi:2-polyprenyl-6-methoxyphenol hydroxylase-like FAD-dependent oxidoreductase
VILDDRPDKTSTGKADGMQPKTIETFKQMRLAEPLLKNAARVHDISFWVCSSIASAFFHPNSVQQSTAEKELHRTGRQTHYPEHLVGASDPYILLAHQGMVEEVLIDDMESRGLFVTRNSRFKTCSRVSGTMQLDVSYEDVSTNTIKTIRTDYLVGCDGARSKVRDFIPDAELEGEITNASWGVLDGELNWKYSSVNEDSNRLLGVIDTDFPDLWSKVAVRSHNAGSILWIPRERNMTRLYVELSATDGERVDRAKATPEYVINKAREAMHPFRLEWKTREWFGNYVVGQRVARHFMDSDARIFIAGDVCAQIPRSSFEIVCVLILDRLGIVTPLSPHKELIPVCMTVSTSRGSSILLFVDSQSRPYYLHTRKNAGRLQMISSILMLSIAKHSHRAKQHLLRTSMKTSGLFLALVLNTRVAY